MLTNQEKRREYDQFGKDYVEQKEKGGNQESAQSGNFGQFFSQMFGGGGSNFNFQFGDDDGDDFGGFGGFGQEEEIDLFQNEDSLVILLDEKSYKNALKSGKQWFILYFSNQCQNCHSFAPVFEKLAKKLQNIVNLGAINCQTFQRACRGVAGYPEIHLFAEESDEENDEIRTIEDSIQFEGPKRFTRVLHFVLRNLPSNVNQIRYVSLVILFFSSFI